jgi:hypothetical protein
LKLAKIAIIQVLGLMEDESTFSMLSSMNFKLKNRFNEHLNIVVRMYLVGVDSTHNCSMLSNKKIQIVFQKYLRHTQPMVVFILISLYILFTHFYLL